MSCLVGKQPPRWHKSARDELTLTQEVVQGVGLTTEFAAFLPPIASMKDGTLDDSSQPMPPAFGARAGEEPARDHPVNPGGRARSRRDSTQTGPALKLDHPTEESGGLEDRALLLEAEVEGDVAVNPCLGEGAETRRSRRYWTMADTGPLTICQPCLARDCRDQDAHQVRVRRPRASGLALAARRPRDRSCSTTTIWCGSKTSCAMRSRMASVDPCSNRPASRATAARTTLSRFGATPIAWCP